VSALIEEAKSLVEAGKIEEAVEKVNQARDRSPDNLEAAKLYQELQLRKSELSGELAAVRDLLAQDVVPEPDIARAVRALDRVHEIERIMVAQIGVLETMNPADFLAFRDDVGTASGFQSAQFRELEYHHWRQCIYEIDQDRAPVELSERERQVWDLLHGQALTARQIAKLMRSGYHVRVDEPGVWQIVKRIRKKGFAIDGGEGKQPYRRPDAPPPTP